MDKKDEFLTKLEFMTREQIVELFSKEWDVLKQKAEDSESQVKELGKTHWANITSGFPILLGVAIVGAILYGIVYAFNIPSADYNKRITEGVAECAKSNLPSCVATYSLALSHDAKDTAAFVKATYLNATGKPLPIEVENISSIKGKFSITENIEENSLIIKQNNIIIEAKTDKIIVEFGSQNVTVREWTTEYGAGKVNVTLSPSGIDKFER